ncbi:hypothetical protein BHE18_08210 [Rossellomorea aquimaris]|uniref:Polymerase nucleotidyl transferase domain-containing protein n=1 Tax=Rossellomorea aquimaris TaxID=189382 RepID=A0A1J6VYW7_9BACI|nr:hypothetical protein BHE18_08210 [Rossellomorea aquimaris]
MISEAEAANVRFYLFGSVLNNMEYNDVDILILYDGSNRNNIIRVIQLRKVLWELSSIVMKEELDITLLTYKENEERDFIGSENAEYFYP